MKLIFTGFGVHKMSTECVNMSFKIYPSCVFNIYAILLIETHKNNTRALFSQLRTVVHVNIRNLLDV